MHTKKSRILFCAMTLALVALVGCNSYPPKDLNQATGAIYLVAGATVIDANHDATVVVGTILRDSVSLTTAKVTFALDSLSYTPTPYTSDSVYAKLFSSSAKYAGGSYLFKFADSAAYSDSASILVPAGFVISGVVPPNRIANGGENVSLDWTGAANAADYVIAAVLRGQQYQGVGFSQYAASATTAATFNRDAFYPSHGAIPDTGWYNLYVYAISGSPDSALTKMVLPVPLPSQLSANVTGDKVAGHWGSVRVVLRDSVQVVAQ